MFLGALFQALVASFMNVDVDFSEVPSSIILPFVMDLVIAESLFTVLGITFVG